MKLNRKIKKGFSLLEVIIAIAIVSVFVISFITGISNSYIALYKSKSLTETTFLLQEIMEEKIADFTIDDLNLGGPDVDIKLVFDKNVKYKKLTANIENSNRDLVAYISQPKIGLKATPKIESLTVKAYNELNQEIYPWHEDGTRLEAKYSDDDLNIFQMNFAWHESKTSGTETLKNPVFNIDYNKIKYKNGVHRGTMPSLSKMLKFNELKNNRYYHYSILPYSDSGKLGKLATNDRRLLVIKRTNNPYWNNLIENIYLNNQASGLKLNHNPLLLTMNNIDELTLNLESNESNINNTALFYYPLDNYRSNNSSFRTKINMRFDEKAINEETGIGVFLGDYNNSNENGIMFLIKQNDRYVEARRIINGTIGEILNEFYLDDDFNFSNRYSWDFDIRRNRNGQGHMELSYIDESNIRRYLAPLYYEEIIDLNFITNEIGLKTWSPYEIEDELNEEYKYVYNLTAHFYDIRFEGLQN